VFDDTLKRDAIEPPSTRRALGRDGRACALPRKHAEFSLDIDEVELAGDDWAFERGTYTIVLTPKAGGTPIRDTGKYLTIYRRQTDHSWLMARDIWNSNNPLPGQA
jgi:ketosteroid isomerase-like protein